MNSSRNYNLVPEDIQDIVQPLPRPDQLPRITPPNNNNNNNVYFSQTGIQPSQTDFVLPPSIVKRRRI